MIVKVPTGEGEDTGLDCLVPGHGSREVVIAPLTTATSQSKHPDGPTRRGICIRCDGLGLQIVGQGQKLVDA